MHYHLYRIQLNFSRNKFFPSIDANGNLVFHRAEKPALDRRLCWDEENRLMGVADNSYTSFYQYDAAGERTYKLTGEQHKQIVNGQTYTYCYLDNPTLYTSPYLVATRRGYTKHYYAESERIASKIGGENFRLTIFDFRMNKLSSNENYFEHNIMAGSILSTQYHTLPSSQNRQSKIENRQSYHPDHLGSSSWITYSDGKSIQHLHYLPFGESFVDQRISSFGSRYTFSAKEKDEETGYSYFGARYYSSDLSIWLSVDPMSDKYPNVTNYVYCSNNPIRLVDPNGMDEYDFDSNGGLVRYEKNDDPDVIRTQSGVDKSGKPTYQKLDAEATKQFVAIVVGESSNNKEEAEGIGNVMLNRMKLKDVEFESGFSDKIGGKKGLQALDGKLYNDIMGKSLKESIDEGKYTTKIEGAMKALSPMNSDNTNGAYFWNATSQKDKKDVGFNWRQFNNKVFSKTAEIGKTTFFKYNPNKSENPNFYKKIWP